MTFSIQHLLKIDCENNCTLFFTIGFWTIYKLIVNRNITGIDKRKVAAKQIFQREILKRMDIQSNIDMTRKRMFLPKELLSVIKKKKKKSCVNDNLNILQKFHFKSLFCL